MSESDLGAVPVAPHPRHARNAIVRFAISAACGIPVGIFTAFWTNVLEAGLWGWCVFSSVNLYLAWQCVRRTSPRSTQASVEQHDQTHRWLLMFVCASVVVSLASIGFMLSTSKDLPHAQRAAHVAFAAVTVVLSWLLMHVRFAFHYAHLYYRRPRAEQHPLSFPGKAQPSYLDFLYFAFVLGMTSQTADVAINTRALRAVAMLHGLIAFAFNLAILALAINIVASTIL